jgi:hypothetical protein
MQTRTPLRTLKVGLAALSAAGAVAIVPTAVTTVDAVSSPPVVIIGPSEYRDLSGGCYGTYTVSYSGVGVAPGAQIELEYGDGSVDIKIASGFSYTFAPHYFRSRTGNAWLQTAFVFTVANAVSGEGVGTALTTRELGPNCP